MGTARGTYEQQENESNNTIMIIIIITIIIIVIIIMVHRCAPRYEAAVGCRAMIGAHAGREIRARARRH